jgi:hypothetical protein
MSIMKTFITVLAIVITGFLACDTPESTTTSPTDSVGINSNRPDSTVQKSDTSMRRDSL